MAGQDRLRFAAAEPAPARHPGVPDVCHVRQLATLIFSALIVASDDTPDHRLVKSVVKGGSVSAATCSSVTPGARRRSTSPSGVTSKTARLVMIRFTTRVPVNGKVHSGTILGVPSLATCSIST